MPTLRDVIQDKYYEIQRRSIKRESSQHDWKATIQHEPFRRVLDNANVTYMQRSMLCLKDGDHNLIKALETLQADVKIRLRRRGYYGELIPIGSTKSQLKTCSLDELDLAFVIDPDQGYSSISTTNPHVYLVHKSTTEDADEVVVEARKLRGEFAKDVQEILATITLPPGLQHSGYASPKFSGIRFNGPATTMLLTWDPDGEKREISMDITPMIRLPPEDESRLKNVATQRISTIRTEMPHEIFRYDGLYLFPNPISDRWELTSACYEATNLLDRIPRETPFKTSILLLKDLASNIATISVPPSIEIQKQTEEMQRVASVLDQPTAKNHEIMKYGHAFLTPEYGRRHKEMTKKAISINTAAITHVALHLASKLKGSFMTTHSHEEKKQMTSELIADILTLISSDENDVDHFFLNTRISFFFIATWAQEVYDTRLLLNNVKMQCLLLANLLLDGILPSTGENDTPSLEKYRIPTTELKYAEDSFLVPSMFSGERCNETFTNLFKMINALGNTVGGIIHVVSEVKTEHAIVEIEGKKDTESYAALWEEAFTTLCRSCDVLEYITFFNKQKHALDIQVQRFPTKRSLEVYSLRQGHANHISELFQTQFIQYHVTDDGHIHQSKTDTDNPSRVELPEAGSTPLLVCGESLKEHCLPRSAKDSSTSHPIPVGSIERKLPTASLEENIHTLDQPQLAGLEPSLAGSSDGSTCVQQQIQSQTGRKFWKQCDQLGWTTNNRQWNRNLRQVHIDIDDSVKEMVSILMPVSPMSFTPSKEAILYQYPQLDHAIDYIQKQVGDTEAVAIACKCWPQLADIKFEGAPESIHIMDVVAVSQSGMIHIFSLVDSGDRQVISRAQQYVIGVGHATKRAICGNRTGGFDVHIQCHVYCLSTKQAGCSGVALGTSDDITGLIDEIAHMLMRKPSYYKDQIGKDINIILSARQLEIILQSAFEKYILVEGPPGSGKTYMALYLSSKYAKNRVLYICTTLAFKNFLIYQQNCVPELVQNECDVKTLWRRVNLENYDCVIIDDGHQLSCSSKTWMSFLGKAKEYSCKIYIFMDSHHQNFRNTDTNPLRRSVAQLERGAKPHILDVIHRNSRKVSSFLMTTSEDVAKVESSVSKLACSSQVDGEDVKVRYLTNILEASRGNSLLRLVRSILQDTQTEQLNTCDARDIAILIDTRNANTDKDQLMLVFHEYAPDLAVHSAGVFPVTGITVDTLDNFVGLDRPVCICITRESTALTELKEKIFRKSSKHSMFNPKYRTFIASRGVSSVYFIIDKPVDVNMAKVMKMDLLPYEPRLLWTTLETTVQYISCMFDREGGSAFLYTTASGISLVAGSGRRLHLELDTTGLRRPDRVDCTPDGGYIVVIGRGEPFRWAVFRRENALKYSLQATFELDMETSATRWTPNHDVVMVVYKGPLYNLRRYSAKDGRMLWERKNVFCKFPGQLAVEHNTGEILVSGEVMVSRSSTIHVYSPDGHMLKTIQFPIHLELPAIWAICPVDSEDVLTGHVDGSVRLWGASDTYQAEHVLIKTGKYCVWGMTLSRHDRLLALHTSNAPKQQLSIYDVEGILL